jgi:hypothetical protein
MHLVLSQRCVGSCGSSVFTANTSGQRRILMVYSILDTSRRSSINVSAGIVGDCSIGLHVLSHRLRGNHCRDFLLYALPYLLEDVPLAVRAPMWYMHDGALAHFSCAVRDVLNNTYHGRWIGRGGHTHGLHARQT